MTGLIKRIAARLAGASNADDRERRVRTAPTSVVSPMLSRLAEEPSAQTGPDEAELRRAYLKSEAMLRDIRS